MNITKIVCEKTEPGRKPTSIHWMKNPTALAAVKEGEEKIPAQWIALSRAAGYSLKILNVLFRFLKIVSLINENLNCL